MASAVLHDQSLSGARWFGDLKIEEGAPIQIVRSEEVHAESDASPAAEESIPRAFEGIIGASGALKHVLADVKIVVSAASTVLREGKTGNVLQVSSQAN